MSLPMPQISPDDPRWTKRGAIYIPADEGVTKWVSDSVYSVKVHSDITDGHLGFVEAQVPPGSGPVAHVHNRNSEAFYLLDGELEFLNGDEKITARSGDFIYVPPGIRHRFLNKSTRHAKMLFLFTPGGPEALFMRGDEPTPGVPAPLWDAERFADYGEAVSDLDIDSPVLPEG
ncbi:Cupin domain-containing protein [Streptomyces misionensis]|uniref:Cupin domain-containing protein n=2 Tax=Streptomyces misionensis TaxID=67331 RepID=A0A1H4R0P1_9ACTN|nr:Cupin domain-containing protein [Streptomyces misionensis]